MTTLTEIPSECYVDSIDTANSQHYKVYYQGTEVNNCYGVIRYSPTTTKKPPYNWRARYGSRDPDPIGPVVSKRW